MKRSMMPLWSLLLLVASLLSGCAHYRVSDAPLIIRLPATQKCFEVKIVSRKALNRILLERNQVRYRKILYKHSGFPTASLYYNPVKKSPKQEDLTFMQKLGLASDVVIVFSNIGLHIAILFSSIFALISIFIGIYALIAHYIDKAVISGWTTTMLFLSIGFTGIFITLSIIAKYISNILLEQRHRNLYTTESLEKLNK